MTEASFCLECKQRSGCRAICNPLEQYLGSRGIVGYSERHRRRKEIVWDSQDIENLATQRAFKIKNSWQIKRKYPQEMS